MKLETKNHLLLYSFKRVFVLFFLSSALSVSYAETSVTENHLIKEQDSFYRGNVDDAIAPEPWRHPYTEEERRNAKPMVIQPMVIQVETQEVQRKSNQNKLPRNYDLRTREERIIEPRKINQLLNTDEQQTDDSEGINLKESADSYSSNSSILDTTVSPYSKVVKIFFKKPDNIIYSCSGSLISPSVVLTAAHCVHDGSFNWYSDVEIIPAYNQRASGIAGIFIMDEKPYGAAYGIREISWPYDFSTGDTEGDLAVIELDRPVGGLTSWFGLSTANYCSTLTDKQYTSAGYPGNDPNHSYCSTYNGSQMVTLSGTFDSCSGGRAQFPTVICKGQSGSGHWETDARIIRAVVSGGNSTTNFAAMIETDEYDEIVDFKDGALPFAVALEAMGMQADSSIRTNEQLQLLKFYLFNHSSVRFQGNVSVTFYLSSNDIVSNGDTSLGAYNWNSLDNDQKSGTWLNVSSRPKIPSNVTPGKYYIGAIVSYTDNFGHTVEEIMSTEDVQEIEVIQGDDNYEQNNTLETAKVLSERTWYDGVLLDDDWYKIYVDTEFKKVEVTLYFAHADGDIDIGLYNSFGSLLSSSTSGSDNESISHTVPQAGDYYIKVYGYNGAHNEAYDLWWDDVYLDSDDDSMPDSYEILYGFDPFDASDAGEDYDTDGVTNLEEYLSGTNPTDINDYPRTNTALPVIINYLLN